MELKDMNPHIADHYSVKNESRLSLYPPSTDLALKAEALFSRDPSVFTTWSYDKGTFTVYGKKNARKADAINWLLFNGTVKTQKFTVKVIFINEAGEHEELPTPTYNVNAKGVVQFLKDALDGIGFGYEINDVYVPVTETTYFFLEVDPVAIQFCNDNFGNPHGCTTMLAEELIRAVFETGIVMVSSRVTNNL